MTDSSINKGAGEPVPVTVWPAPAAEGDVFSPTLAERLLAEYTHRRAAVLDLTESPSLRGAAVASGRRLTQRPLVGVADHTDQVSLVVAGWPLAPGLSAPMVLAFCRARLLRGGCLAVVLYSAEPTAAGELVVVARRSELTYLQHIVAVHAEATPVRGRVHTDILVFRNPDGRDD